VQRRDRRVRGRRGSCAGHARSGGGGGGGGDGSTFERKQRDKRRWQRGAELAVGGGGGGGSPFDKQRKNRRPERWHRCAALAPGDVGGGSPTGRGVFHQRSVGVPGSQAGEAGPCHPQRHGGGRRDFRRGRVHPGYGGVRGRREMARRSFPRARDDGERGAAQLDQLLCGHLRLREGRPSRAGAG
ncbi:unnamed protein product, partial [Ectocarpus sp. 8 AP-2014]